MDIINLEDVEQFFRNQNNQAMKTLKKNYNLTSDEFYKRCQEMDGKKLLITFRKAQLVLAQEGLKKAEKS